ncbi:MULTISPECIES: TetR/AcrR family transcriptional regulator C-terminal domain-containing protein [unclassified Nocardia]|uniref:TetR/AcrR family transcriptional regulator C-terminal domain-containing protein n=1 Tax=unclassified Nocardia TaxID=2637762 RepID=UPI001CE47965|nr:MULTISPECIES: TetR/AcrR family transcriptional regulator C-terminal domain-containing protein [unclassified Nocardia]
MALDRELIVRTALAQLDEVGLAALSLRRLAKDLEVHPSALYHHFQNKQDLLNEMARELVLSVVGEVGYPGATWDTWLTHLARTQRRAIRSRRDGALLMIRARPDAEYQLDYLDQLFELLAAAGFSREQAGAAFIAVSNYTIGMTLPEQQREALTGAARHLDRPGVQSIVAASADADATFETGLRWLIDGMRPA